ncbi:hypothetical protein SYNPS1DRAFT_12437 [Syncephalis pseudoplumigaleata]|uniref:N-acetyltransferase domain-containing protein n=1 Tax=Syncephalis pseudoplumigaleata TaxID=1712513 RepID=A0A4P9Z4Z9_9FUNG|nr:hypothetical protein SYNPS1DRAFT_12437 [Syncephalis pseudoplumigaleata]|eukprot:RKP27596.1 hypothetical protein SYNPS1DRAFT_12437 [Syncephalis pseudoplumigaleata]
MHRALEFALVIDVTEAYALEREGYPPSEAASLEALVYRQKHAPELFLGAYLPPSSSSDAPSLVGFITATLTAAPFLTAASMTQHDPRGKTVCIHSVCVASAHRRKGIALALLREYEHRLRQANAKYALATHADQNRYDKVALIAHEHLIPLYQQAGYALIGASSVEHGPDPWFELHLVL